MLSPTDVIEYRSLGPDVVAFTTKRTVGRDRERLCQMLDIDDLHIVVPHQVHLDKVVRITADFTSRTAEEQHLIVEGVDAVFTSEQGILIGVSTADCIPVLLYDPMKKVAAAIHAGWRGTVKKISQLVIETMIAECGTNPADIRAVIGPGISQKNFEVGDEVYAAFAQEGFDMNSIAEKYAKWHLDLWEANRQLLCGSGVGDANIHIERICTYNNTDQLFSARMEQKGIEKCGRNFNAIMIKPEL